MSPFLLLSNPTPFGSSVAAPLLAAIGLEPVQRLKSEMLSPLHRRFAMDALAAAPEAVGVLASAFTRR